MATDAEPTPSFFFTYSSNPASNDLEQGDILKKTPELTEVLHTVHPYYTKESYSHFIVLTQSCDLVRRDGHPPKARYITLAAVRPMQIVIERELEKYQNEFSKKAMVCKQSVRDKLSFFVGQLLNNNSPEYFYLHSQPEVGFTDRSCAFLRLSVSIKATLHYETCYRARLISLNPLFKAKLGWLVGTMYSRVGTDDWVPKQATEEQFSAEMNDIVEELCEWVDDKQLKKSQDASPDNILERSRDEIRAHIRATKIPRRREELLKAVTEVVKEMNPLSTEHELEQLKKRLSVHPVFKEFSK